MLEISIIVPVYKAEKYISRCIDSILAQTFNDFELILVDDGSPDHSGAICDGYAQKDVRIRVIHKENGGPSSCRNEGMRIASGRYIMFCDSDDYVHPQWCELLHNAIVEHPHAWIVSNVFRVADGVIQTNEKKNAGKVTVEESYFSLYKRGLSAYVWNKIYNMNLIRQNHLRFDESCKFAEDVGFNVSYCLLCSSCVYIPKALYYYVQDAERVMKRYHADLFLLHLLPFGCRLPLITGKDLDEYCDIWLYQLQHLFENVFDPRNSMTFLQKLQYNHRMMNTKEFRYCLAHASGKNENKISLCILKTHNYYIYWLFNKLVRIKQKIRRK